MTSEARISREIIACINAPNSGARIYRNHVGGSWHGESARVTPQNLNSARASLRPGDVIVRQGRFYASGLRPGSGDYIGLVSVPVIPEMVGETVGVFLSIETKRPRNAEERQAQQDWAANISRAGGRAGFARSAEEAAAITWPDRLA
jgi:hypothetical protein